MDNSPSNNPYNIFEYLQKASGYFVGIALVLYLLGFVITNLYLGSLGVINLEVLKSRYILSGFLFLIFLGCIAVLNYGALKTLKKYGDDSFITLIVALLVDFTFNLSCIYVLIKALNIVSGVSAKLPVGIPHISPIVPWSNWLNYWPINAVRTTFEALFVILLIFMIIVILIITLVLIINPKNKEGNREPRKKILQTIGNSIWNFKSKIPKYLLVTFILIYLMTLSTSFINFLTTNQTTLYEIYDLPAGWLRFIIAIGVIDFVLIIIEIFRFRAGIKNVIPSLPPLKSFENFSMMIYLASWFITIVLPLYTIGIYPNIPQQIGGGQVIKVEISTSDTNLQSSIDALNSEIYLIDRSPNTMLFFISNSSENKVIEISSSLINRITYKSVSQ